MCIFPPFSLFCLYSSAAPKKKKGQDPPHVLCTCTLYFPSPTKTQQKIYFLVPFLISTQNATQPSKCIAFSYSHSSTQGAKHGILHPEYQVPPSVPPSFQIQFLPPHTHPHIHTPLLHKIPPPTPRISQTTPPPFSNPTLFLKPGFLPFFPWE